MARSVKRKRSYDSTRRREQAAATRLEILDAAQKLFERDGYAATTMSAIAKEAGVSLKTVYLGFDRVTVKAEPTVVEEADTAAY